MDHSIPLISNGHVAAAIINALATVPKLHVDPYKVCVLVCVSHSLLVKKVIIYIDIYNLFNYFIIIIYVGAQTSLVFTFSWPFKR